MCTSVVSSSGHYTSKLVQTIAYRRLADPNLDNCLYFIYLAEHIPLSIIYASMFMVGQ
jgi:hypothetical protein